MDHEKEHAMRTTSILSLSAMLALAGCGAAAISPELRTARDTMDQARSGQAARLEPDQLRIAERTLSRAEEAPDGSPIERDLAYIADRQTRIAMADADLVATRTAMQEEQRQYQSELERTAIDRNRQIASQQGQIAQMQRELQTVQGQLGDVRSELERRGRTLNARTQELQQRERDLALRERQLIIVLEESQSTAAQLGQAQTELDSVRRELGQVRGRLDLRTQTLDETTQRLEARERELALRQQELEAAMQARADAEERARVAMQQLQELASVRQEQDEVIITLSGEVLFEYNQAELRSTARQRLRAVAAALRTQPDAQIVIEGHTDARGSDDYNEQLSQRRAEAVRQFLVQEGVEMSRLRAVGRGEELPIASNDTEEGRANNRRVEIHFRPTQAAALSARTWDTDERVAAQN
jgi:outer membrane protein OmpA-like peptidoglycan-associated protein